MKISIQVKFLVVCIALVILTSGSISAAYYLLAKQDKHQESWQQIQMAFDIIFDGFTNRIQSHIPALQEVVSRSVSIRRTTSMYDQDGSKLASPEFIASSLSKVGEELKIFGQYIVVDRLAIYGSDHRLLAFYWKQAQQEVAGIYVISHTGQDTFLDTENREIFQQIIQENLPIPDIPLPAEIAPRHEGEFSQETSTQFFSEGRRLGFRTTIPVFHLERQTGILVADLFYPQQSAERYAALTQTQINFFSGTQFSIGTLASQSTISDGILQSMPSCHDLIEKNAELAVFPVTIQDDTYYQGQCSLMSSQGPVGAVTVSLAQQIERDKVRNILAIVLTISGIAIIASLSLSLFLSRTTIYSLHNIVDTIEAAADGDLRETAEELTHDEIGDLAQHLNHMIGQLRTISGQIQTASLSVHTTADSILQEMTTLALQMEQQSSSVDNTTGAVEHVDRFIHVVDRNTNDLLTTAEQIRLALRDIRTKRQEIASTTDRLSANLHHISSSVDEVSSSIKHVSESSEQLAAVAEQTGVEIHRIDRTLNDVSHNAVQSQQLAQETMEAAQEGQIAAENSIQGISDLKDVVSRTTDIMQDVNSWSEQVSSILTIVDEITEQTSLLALNAAIISAQAGEHGRGFAVVADEIKNLALRTKASTQEISGLIRTLQQHTQEGVHNIHEGLVKADEGVRLVSEVKQALNTILERATRTSSRASSTASVIQKTASSSQAIESSITIVTDMVSQIRTALQDEEQDIVRVVSAVDNIREVSDQVNQTTRDQNIISSHITESMGTVTQHLSEISEQTEQLKTDSTHIVTAMHTIEMVTEKILTEAVNISDTTANNLVQQANILQRIVNIFKLP